LLVRLSFRCFLVMCRRRFAAFVRALGGGQTGSRHERGGGSGDEQSISYGIFHDILQITLIGVL
jgi:hypothetical protein